MAASRQASGWLHRMFALMLVLSCAAVADDVILDPDPLPDAELRGTVGLLSESAGYAYAYSSSGGVGYSASVGSDGRFTLATRSGNPYSVQVNLSSFQGAPGASLNQTVYNQPALAPGETRDIDLRRAGGRISASVSVIGGTPSYINLRTDSSDATVPESFRGYASGSGGSVVLPVPALVQTRIYGSVSIVTAGGCNVGVSLPQKYVDVVAGGYVSVSWSVDVSTQTCDRGDLQGEFTIGGLGGANADAIVGSKYLEVSGNDYRYTYLAPSETAYSFEDLRIGSYRLYSTIGFSAPYGGLNAYTNYGALQIQAGSVTQFDWHLPLATAHGQIEVDGPWGLADLQSAHIGGNSNLPDRSASAWDPLDAATGEFDLVIPAGNFTANNLYFYDSEYDNLTGRYEYWQLSRYHYTPLLSTSVSEGDRVEAGVYELTTSQALQPFSVAQSPGQPPALISGLNLRGSGYERDPVTNATLSGTSLYSDLSFPAASSVGVMIRGLPGTYQMSAEGYGTDGRRYRASFQLTLGVPGNTPTGSDVTQQFTGENGASVGNLTFDNVIQAGDTTLSVTTLGPNPPPNFRVSRTGGQPQYFDITTTAVFDGEVKVCINYNDDDLDDPTKESRLELGHYDADTATWETITLDGYPDTVNNVICGMTDSFSIFALLEIDILDSDADGLADDEDNCPFTANSAQSDFDEDGVGDACDMDSDGDAIPDEADLCPGLRSTDNNDLDADGAGDPCDADVDGDDAPNTDDNCPLTPNGGQEDFDLDGSGDECDTDDDADAVLDVSDSCPGTTAGDMIDPDGCSSVQRLDRACPVGGAYRNHGQYVSCVAREAEYQVSIGLIDEAQKGAIVSTAAKSDIGGQR